MASLRYPLLVLASGGFVSGMSIRLAEPLLPKLAQDLETSVTDASVVIWAFAFAYGAFQLVHGPLGDRVGKLRTVCGAMFLAAFASAACALSDSLASLSLFRFFTGMTAGAVIPLSFAFVGDNVPFERRQPVLGRFISGTLLGAAFGPLLGGVFSDLLGWRASFLAPAIAFFLIALALWPLARRETPPAAPGPGPLAAYISLLRSANARTICLAVAIEGALFYGAFAYTGAYLRHEFALSYTLIGMVVAGFGLGGLAYCAAVGWLVRQLGPPRMVALGGCVLVLAFTLLAVGPRWTFSIPAVGLMGLGFYLVHNTLQTRATEMAPAARGAAISLFAFALFFGQALGVAASGQVAMSLGYAFLFIAAGGGLLALALWFASTLRAGAASS